MILEQCVTHTSSRPSVLEAVLQASLDQLNLTYMFRGCIELQSLRNCMIKEHMQ